MVIHRKGPETSVLIAEYLAGATTVELGQKYGMHHTAVGGRIRRAGVEIRPARARALYDDPTQMAEALRLYASGLSVAEVGRRLGFTHSTMARAFKAKAVQRRPHGLRSASIDIPKSETVLAYMAGLFDGEGNLQMRKRGAKSVGCKLAVYSTTSDVMNWVHRNFGGSLRWDHKRTQRHGWKPIGIWELYRAQDVGRLLVALLPYLIIKRAAALDALRHFERELHLTFTPDNDPIEPG